MSTTVRQVVTLALNLSGHIQPAATHTVTARTLVDAALKALNVVDPSGAIISARAAKYYSMAIPIVNKYNREILARENPVAVATDITSLDSILSISDDAAVRYMPDALAMEFATADRLIETADLRLSQFYNFDLSSIRIQSAGDTNKYVSTALSICNVLQLELLKCEGTYETPDLLTSLDDVLTVTDSTALGVMPYGLAARWALTENSALYNDMYANYINSKKAIVAKPTKIIDVYKF